nr:hypothetical protein [Rhizobium sp. MHM7A]
MPNSVTIIWTAVGKNNISGMRTNASIKTLLIVSIVLSPERMEGHTQYQDQLNADRQATPWARLADRSI